MYSQFKQSLLQREDDRLSNLKAYSECERHERLNIYRNNVFVSLNEALSEIFPVTKQLVGEAFFNAVGQRFIEQHPPSSPILSQYGDQFSPFIANFPPAASIPYLAELIDLEYQLLQLTHAAERPVLNSNEIQQHFSHSDSPGRLRFTLTKECRLLATRYAVAAIHYAHQNNRDNEEDHSALHTIQWDNGQYLLLAKSGLYGRYYVITETEYLFISKLISGSTLEESIPNEAFDVSSTLANLIQWQVITAISSIKEQ
jgi:hypothetical protein